jgi:adenosylhomocysteine nucleosidase
MIVVACGMASEAAIIGSSPGVSVIVGAGDARSLAAKLDAAVTAGATHILSVGVAGALSPDLRVGEVVVGVSASEDGAGALIHCDQAWTQRIYRSLTDGPKPVAFPVSFGNVTSTIAPVATEAQRAALRASTAADIVDQESWLAASAAKAHGLPLAILRIVLDRYDFDLPPAALLPFTPSGGNDIEAILGSVMRNPLQIAALLKLAAWSETAMGNLSVALSMIGSDFCAYPPATRGASA